MALFYIQTGVVVATFSVLWFLHWLSYTYVKNKVLRRQRWDLNVCCGKTDGGGINADIIKHGDVPKFKLIETVYQLPFVDAQFDNVLCSHTIEHVEDPKKMFTELTRVGKSVTLLVPPLWDICAAFNIFEHKTLFLTFKSEHSTLPPHVRLVGARLFDKVVGQIQRG